MIEPKELFAVLLLIFMELATSHVPSMYKAVRVRRGSRVPIKRGRIL